MDLDVVDRALLWAIGGLTVFLVALAVTWAVRRLIAFERGRGSWG